MSTIKVDTIATRTGSGNITASNDIAGNLVGNQSGGTVSATNITASGTITGNAGGSASAPALGIITGALGVNGIYSPAANSLGFVAGGAIRGRFTADGLLFGTDTAAANALNDYEEGTWTPVLSGGASATIGDATGQYVKIGDMVYFTFRLTWSSGSSMNNQIGGLPFTVTASSPSLESDYWMTVTPYVNSGFGSLPSGKGYVNGYCERNNTIMYFTWQPNTLQATLDTGGNIYAAGYYKSQ